MTDPNRLSDEQIDCAFDFFLSYDQMTKKIDMPNASLESLIAILNEKQSDLELAAQIGKSLLERNRDLDKQLKSTEHQMASAVDTINQLQHTLGMKDELLQMWHQHVEDTSPEDSRRSFSESTLNPPRFPGDSSRHEELDRINRKIQVLEEEHANIRNEKAVEQGEALRDLMKKLSEAVSCIHELSDEQFKKSDALVQQQNHLVRLLSKTHDLENNLNHLGLKNELLTSKVEELNAVNLNLNAELRDVKDKYDESIAFITQTQSALRQWKQEICRVSPCPSCSVMSPVHSPTVRSAFSLPSAPNRFLDLDANPLLSPTVYPSGAPAHNRFASSRPPTPSSTLHRPHKASLAEEFEQLQIHLGENIPSLSYENEFLQPHPFNNNLHASPTPAKPHTSTAPIEEEGSTDNATMASSGFVSCSYPMENIKQPGPQEGACDRHLLGNPGPLSDPQHTLAGDFSWGDSSTDNNLLAEDSDIEEEMANAHLDAHLHGLFMDAPRTQHDLTRVPRRPHCGLSAPHLANSATRRSWMLEGSNQSQLSAFFTTSGRQRSLDDNATIASSAAKRFPLNPNRIQVVKKLEDSCVLRRWQKLATPSITAALFESPVKGVLSRTDSSPAIWPRKSSITSRKSRQVDSFVSTSSAQPRLALPEHFSMIPNNQASTPMSISSIFAQPVASGASTTSTGHLFDKFLASNRELSASRVMHRSSNNITNSDPLAQRSPGSPVTADRSIKSLSPMCRGLLDVSDMSPSDASIVRGATVTLPVINRPPSPERAGPVWLRKVAPASLQLNSVKEEPS